MAGGVRGRRARPRRRCTPTRAPPASTPAARWSWRWRGPTSTTPRCKLPYQDNLSRADPRADASSRPPARRCSARRGSSTRSATAPCTATAPIQPDDALVGGARAVPRRLLARPHLRRAARPAPGLAFDAGCAAQDRAASRSRPPSSCSSSKRSLRERDEKLAALLADKTALDEELKRLRAEVAAAKKAAAAQPDTHDYSEAETRDYFIDLLLKEAGWPLDQPRDREFEVSRHAQQPGQGLRRLRALGRRRQAARRWSRPSAPGATPRVGQQQAKLYADCLEQQFGQRPVIFYSNGYEHWLWDDASYPPRAVQGFYKKAELELLIQRRTTPQAAGRRRRSTRRSSSATTRRAPSAASPRRSSSDHDRKALLVMATGAGKTRTVIALCDLLMRCNWAKRVLFLADRVALVNQAVNAFKAHLPDASPVNLVTEKDAEGRVFVSTYPTMMGLIDETRDGQRRFGVGHFDLVDHRRGAPLGLPEVPRHLRLLRLAAGRADRDAEGRGRPQHLRPVRPGERRADRRLLARGGGAATASSCRRRRCRCRSSSSARASRTTSCPRRRRTSGTRWSGTRTATCPTASRPRRSTSGCSTRTPSTRCWRT